MAEEKNRQAKERGSYLYANTGEVSDGKGSSTTVASGNTRSFEGTVIRIWSGDQISVAEKDSSKERRIQFSSTRCPRFVNVYLFDGFTSDVRRTAGQTLPIQSKLIGPMKQER